MNQEAAGSSPAGRATFLRKVAAPCSPQARRVSPVGSTRAGTSPTLWPRHYSLQPHRRSPSARREWGRVLQGCHLLRGQYCPRSNSRVTIVCLNREIDNSHQPRSSLLFRTSSGSDSDRGVRCPIGANWMRSADITRGSLDPTQLAATLVLEGPSCGLPRTRTPTSVGAWYRVAEGLSAAPHRLSSDR